MRKTALWLALAVGTLGGVGMTGCDDDDVGDQIEDAADEVGDAAEDAADEVEDAVERDRD